MSTSLPSEKIAPVSVNIKDPQDRESTRIAGGLRRHHSCDALPPLFLLVDNTLYRVDKHTLSQFQYFRNIFGDPATTRGHVKGLSESNPLRLNEVTTSEMESLLHIFEPRCWFKQAQPSLDGESWKAVLRLATKWGCPELRDYAMRSIERLKLKPVEMIVLSRHCKVDKWLRPACLELCIRSEPLTVEEGKLLGIELAMKLVQIREKYLPWTRCSRCGSRSYTCNECRASITNDDSSKQDWHVSQVRNEISMMFARTDSAHHVDSES
ncbi:hypothetical protein FRC03_002588 [Tulasnella sp. 419]|nr:hypothetical protein FRC03_002588 [Tulasnella sp. 419]